MDDFTKRFVIAFVVCVALFFKIDAQDLPKEPISKHITTHGEIFWHKDLPYYVFISDDSTGTNSTLLHSKNQAKYANPAYFDTYGYNYIRTKWAVDRSTHKTVYPQQEITWEVFVDGTPPVTTPEFSSKSEYKVNGTRYFTSDLMMEFKVFDENSGPRSTYYSLNDSAYIKYEQAVALNPKDTFKIKYFSVDNVGNYEKVRIFKYEADDYDVRYAVDSYAPVTSLVADFVRNYYLGPNMPISFTSKDKGAGVALTNYKIDDGELQPYTGPFKLDIPEGVHKLTYFSADYVTNKEEDQVKMFYFDRTLPTMFISAGGSYFSSDSVMFVSDSTQIKFSAYDPLGVKRIAYKFTTDKSYQVYTGKPITLPVDYPAKQELRYFATDSVDNDSEVYVIKLMRDRSAPTLKFVLTGPSYHRGDTIYVTNNTMFSVIAKDSLSGVRSNHVYVNGAPVKNVTFNADTAYAVIDTLRDQIGNTTIMKQLYVRDSEAPVIDYIFSNPPSVDGTSTYPDGTVLFFAVTDYTGLSAFKITINGKLMNGTTFIGKAGVYKAEVTAIDWLKQVSQKSIEFTIK